MFGRNGESPVPIVAPQTPSDCFDAAMEAVRIATTHRTPVFVLSDGYLANGSGAVAGARGLLAARASVEFATEPNGVDAWGTGFPPLPARRRDAGPSVGGSRHGGAGAPDRRHREADVTGNISTTPTTTTG